MQLVHLLVPAQADVGGVPDLLHRRQAQRLVGGQRRRHVAAVFAEGLVQRHRVFHRQARAGADGEVRRAQRVTHQHHVAEAPAAVPDRGKLAPVGIVGQDGVAVQVLGEHLLAKADGVFRAHRSAKPARCQVASSTSTRKVLMVGL
jgi:hypothetical protein